MSRQPSASYTGLLLACPRPFDPTLPDEPDRLATIYRVTCTVNGKAYVGQTVQKLQTRWRAHVAYALRGGDKMALARAIRRHGALSFAVEILQTVVADEADGVEAAWIARLGCRVPAGYNLETGGQRGKREHASTREKMNVALKAGWATLSLEERRVRVAKMHAAMTPAARSERSRRNASMRMTTAQHAERMRKVNAAIKPETRVAAGRAGWANQSPQQRAVRIEKIRSSLSHDQRRDMALRAWNTRGRRCSQEELNRAAVMHAAGHSLSAIARTLKITRETITQALKRAGRY